MAASIVTFGINNHNKAMQRTATLPLILNVIKQRMKVHQLASGAYGIMCANIAFIILLGLGLIDNSLIAALILFTSVLIGFFNLNVLTQIIEGEWAPVRFGISMMMNSLVLLGFVLLIYDLVGYFGIGFFSGIGIFYILVAFGLLVLGYFATLGSVLWKISESTE